MGKIFITSDLHIGHDKDFVWKARGYKSVKEMNTNLIQKWNNLVDDDDDVYVLGDLILGDKSNIEYLKELKGKIHIVLGNHDTTQRQMLYKELPNVVEMSYAIMLKYKKYHFFMTHFPSLTGNIEKESLKQMTLNLYGHTHQKNNFYNDLPYMYHVGVDSHVGHPVPLDDIIEDMREKMKEYNILKKEEDIKQPRCSKCIYEPISCGENDFYKDCKKYKREPSDGGFYG